MQLSFMAVHSDLGPFVRESPWPKVWFGSISGLKESLEFVFAS